MGKFDNYECQGQMSIFDFLGAEGNVAPATNALANIPIVDIVHQVEDTFNVKFRHLKDLNTDYYRLYELYVSGHRIVLERISTEDKGHFGLDIDNMYVGVNHNSDMDTLLKQIKEVFDGEYTMYSQKRVFVDVKGLCDDPYCPKCGVRLDEDKRSKLDKCPECGTLLDWKSWLVLNPPCPFKRNCYKHSMECTGNYSYCEQMPVKGD